MARDTVTEIKDRLSIVDVVSPYVKLTRAGKSLRGLCPFHKEKTPSLHVSPDRGTWHCFGCGLGGDEFSFIEKIEGVDFKGALKILAEKAGVVIENSIGDHLMDSTKKDRLLSLMNRASEWYASQFGESPADTYAKQRGISGETISFWRLGYAPDTWRALLEALTREGFSMEDLLSAGLIKEAEGKTGTYYDRFRNRLMFTIRDVAGRVVGFTGRALIVDVQQAKYLNSPETDLYHKSEILFGMYEAKEFIRERDFTMLMEGQIDVLLAHQAGFKNAIALSGTTLTERQVALMGRYSKNLMLILDADVAGLKATARSAIFALHSGLRVKAVQLPKGKDPADLISESEKEFAKRVASAKPIVEFFLGEIAQREINSHQLLRAAEDMVLPLINAIPSPMEREHFVQTTARSLGLSNETVRESLRNLSRNSDVSQHASEAISSSRLPVRSSAEIRSEQLLSIVHAYPDTTLAKRVESEYCRITGVQKLPFFTPPESALFYAEQTFGEDPDDDAVDELLRAFEEAVIREAYETAVSRLRRAEASGDTSLVSDAQKVCAELSAKLAILSS